jgi:sarcosine oxidase, subunit alpha
MSTMNKSLARTPLHHWHKMQNAQFHDLEGWQVVKTYSTAESEITAARIGLALADVSAFAKVRVRSERDDGKRGTVRQLEIASARWHACFLSEDHALLLASKPRSLKEPLISWPNCRTLDVTSTYAGFIVLGLHLEPFLRRVTHFDVRLASWPINSCAETSLARVEAILVRSDEFEVPSVRILVPWDVGEYVWERLLEAGREWQMTPIGLDALSMLALR